MTVQEIWIASYLVPGRFRRFKKALESFRDQTLKTPVCVSVCGPDSWRAKQWTASVLGDVVQYELFLYEERWSQFDQLYMISKNRTGARNVFISVCDDDDMFLPQRMEVQQKYLEDGQICLKCKASDPDRSAVHSDFGSFCFRLTDLEKFFQETKGSDLTLPPDLLFMALLKSQDIPEALHIKTPSFFTRTWDEKRNDGTSWFSPVLF